MEPKRKDLIDTRGRKTLLESRKRRRDSVLTTPDNQASSLSCDSTHKMTRPSVDLGALLQPAHLPPAKYYAIQSVLFKQDAIITDREKVVQDCNQEVKSLSLLIDKLKKQLEDAHAKTQCERDRAEKGVDQILSLKRELARTKDHQAGNAREFLDRKRYLQGVNDNQADLMLAGRRILAEKTGETTRLAAENSQLRATVGNRDRTISALNDQIIRISMSPGNEVASIAIEAQAQRTLGMVKGLKGDVAERDLLVEEYKAKNEALAAANLTFKVENDELKSKSVYNERALKAAEKRASEAKEILEDQNKLIDKLMKDNARLLEASQKK